MRHPLTLKLKVINHPVVQVGHAGVVLNVGVSNTTGVQHKGRCLLTSEKSETRSAPVDYRLTVGR